MFVIILGRPLLYQGLGQFGIRHAFLGQELVKPS
jgi:hypothetical protein